jgi:hypothetical protein
VVAPFVDRFQEAVDAARNILQGDNDCSKFFGGAGITALVEIEKFVKNAGSKAYASFQGDNKTGIQMDIPTQVNRSDLPLLAGLFDYFAIAPNNVRINSNGAFAMAAGNNLPRFGNYNAGSLRSRVLQLLHEVGHLVVIRTDKTVRFIKSNKQKRPFEQWKLTPLLPLDGKADQKDLSAANTKRVLDACRSEIDKIPE